VRTPEHITLVVNAGSSSVKGALFTFEPQPQAIARKTIDAAGAAAVPRLHEWLEASVRDHVVAAIGHRVVHGGPRYSDPQVVTPTLLHDLERLIPWAPNHLPDEISLIEGLARQRPGVRQVVCFDTAFHQTLPEVARRLPIPKPYDSKGIRRYGFHGLSYAYLVEELRRVNGDERADGRLILAHLGNGSSLTAVHHGRSVDTTMAFTPMAGVVMSTRSGDLDPGVVTYLARAEGLSANDLEEVLSRRAGLIAISDVTGDMRALVERQRTDPACQLAIDAYTYSIKKTVGALAAALGGLDTLIFSGGIGEHSAVVRAGICDDLAFLGIQLDAEQNHANARAISTPASRVLVQVIPTDEELMIARAVYRLLASN
jgi:acetate kinase